MITVEFEQITVEIRSAIEVQLHKVKSVDVQQLPELSPWDHKEIGTYLAEINGLDPHAVNCHAGQHRSPSIAILYLWKKSGKTLGEVYDAVQQPYTAAEHQAQLTGTGFDQKFREDSIQSSLTRLLSAHAPVKVPRHGGWFVLRAQGYSTMKSLGF